jgi:hypothetical protein
MDIQDELRRHLKTVSLVGWTIFASLLIYLAMAMFINVRFRPFQGFAAVANLRRLSYILVALAIVAIVLLRLVRQILLKKVPGEDPKTALHRLERVTLLTLVLAEVPGILGLIGFLLAGLNLGFYVLLVVSVVLVFMYFPRRSGWEEWLS